MSEQTLEKQLVDLEDISEKISNLIFENDFDEIIYLDKKRQIIIEDIKNYNSEEFKKRLYKIYKNNLINIKETEEKIVNFSVQKNKSLKRFQAYFQN